VGKVLAGLVVLVFAAVGYVWWRTTDVPVAPVAGADSGAASAPAADDAPPRAGRSEPAARPARARATESGDAPLSLEINSEAELIAAMRSLGIEDLDQRMTRWAIAHGYPEFDQAGNYLLDQPYQQYDEQTLRGLAEADDMWAQQILAQQIADDRPAEALELYRRAAVNGSVYAMQEMARLYHRMSNQLRDLSASSDAGALEQEYAVRDASTPEVSAYAWLAAAEQSGWDATRGASLIPLLGRRLSPEQVTEACALAQTLRTQIDTERSSRGLQPYDRTPPPIVYPAEEIGAATECGAEDAQPFDMSGCREADVKTGATSTRVWVCAPPG
jgi:hypothetical protein